MGNLRRQAEAKLAREHTIHAPRLTEDESQRLRHELEVHQIELELQNQELRIAQSETAAALELYADLFDFAPVGYFNLGSDGTIQLVNLTGAKFTGLERDRIIGRRLGVFVAASNRQAFSDFLATVFSTETKQTCELTLECEGRPSLTVQVEATIRSDGQTCRVVMTDITERIRAEKALLANATFTDDVLNSLNDHVVVLDATGKIIAVNEAWRRFAWKNGASTDYLDENYLTICHDSVMHRDEIGAAQTEAGIHAILEGKQSHFSLEYPCDSPTEARWFRLRVAPLSGETPGVVISHHNISESRLAAQIAQNSLTALLQSKRQLKALFDQAAVGVALSDASSHKFVQVNRRYCEITGYSEAELMKMTFADITHPEDLAKEMEIARKLHNGTLRESTREKRQLRKDHSEIWVTLTVSPMWAPGESPDFHIAVVQDITHRKLLEEQVRQAQKMEAIGTLAGGIAHDFNNILSAINGYTELSLMNLDQNPKVREHLGAVMKAAKRATALVHQILAFSRQQKASRLPLTLGPIVSECITLLRATIPTTIEFDTSLATDAPMVLADASQVHQVLMNLGTNAWQAMKHLNGRLKVKLERMEVDADLAARQSKLKPGIYARVSVSDTGCGMDEATVRRIFEPFYTTKPVDEGTGLGLAVVHGIMDTHEGAITVASTLGQGTVFQLYFPETICQKSHSVTAEAAIPQGQGERLLVVDDESLLVQMMQLTLTAIGYEVETTTKPAEAIAMVRADPGRFALVLTDLTMPGMTGLALATELQAIQPGLPVILSTGYRASLTSEEAKVAGIRQVLPKPASLQALAAAVHQALSVKIEN